MMIYPLEYGLELVQNTLNLQSMNKPLNLLDSGVIFNLVVFNSHFYPLSFFLIKEWVISFVFAKANSYIIHYLSF